MDRRDSSVLVLGLGNRLLGDDAAGPLVVDAPRGVGAPAAPSCATAAPSA